MKLRKVRSLQWQNPMGWTRFLRVFFAIGFALSGLSLANPLAPAFAAAELSTGPSLAWSTFFGAANTDTGMAIAVDGSRNIYITGVSSATWGSPIRPYSGNTEGNDVFVAKLDPSGGLLWNTFLGSADSNVVFSIALDESGNVVVAGSSNSTWGSPLVTHAVGTADAFVAKLNNDGALLWNTFTGSSLQSSGYALTVDQDGNVYTAGASDSTWGSPIENYSGDRDGYVAKYNSDGVLQWNTFVGGTGNDDARGVALDGSGNIIVIGGSFASWGSPLSAFTGDQDAFVTKLDQTGTLLWNTFLGSANSDVAGGLAIDNSGNIVVGGNSMATWGNPVLPFSGYGDFFVAKLDGSGALTWNTFLGTDYQIMGSSLVMDGSGKITVAGVNIGSFGSPVNQAPGGMDAFVAQLDQNGGFLWNIILGSAIEDIGYGTAVDTNGDVYTIGASAATWGSPLNPFSGQVDVFVAKIDVPHTLYIPLVIR